MAMSSRILLITAACLALGACSTVHKNIGQEDPGLGEAERYNAALQTINPAPVYAQGGAQPGDNGDHGAQAVKRYRTGQVKALETISSTTSSSGGSGSTPR
jgi:hypothetical protein